MRYFELRIVVLNTVLSNTGDAAIFQAIGDAMRAQHGAHVELVALDNLSQVTSHLYPEFHVLQQPTIAVHRNRYIRKALSLGRRVLLLALASFPALAAPILTLLKHTSIGRALRAIQSADLVVSSGGTYLVDHYSFGHKVIEMRVANALGKKIILWTQSMGPFSSAGARKSIAKVEGVVDAVYFRDRRSLSAWESVIPLPPKSSVVPDCVFGMDLSEPRVSPEGVARPVAMISVRSWSQGSEGGLLKYSDYVAGMRSLAERLISAGWKCIAISTCQGVPEYSVDDSITARRIFAGLDVEIDSDFHNPTQLLRRISDADLVIATRMHFAILSLISGKRVHAIAYEPKTLELFGGLGASHAVTPIEDVTPRWVHEWTDSLPPTFQADPSLLSALRSDARRPAADIEYCKSLPAGDGRAKN